LWATFSININPVEQCLHYAAKRQFARMRNYTRKMQVEKERFDQMNSQRAFLYLRRLNRGGT